MCAGCPGGRPVSRITAYINLHGLRPAVLRELQRSVGRRARITAFGDQWMLAARTGRREVFDDVEALADALVDRGLVDRGVLARAGAGTEFERLLGARTGRSGASLGAGELVEALLFSASTV